MELHNGISYKNSVMEMHGNPKTTSKANDGYGSGSLYGCETEAADAMVKNLGVFLTVPFQNISSSELYNAFETGLSNMGHLKYEMFNCLQQLTMTTVWGCGYS